MPGVVKTGSMRRPATFLRMFLSLCFCVYWAGHDLSALLSAFVWNAADIGLEINTRLTRQNYVILLTAINNR